ncbi:MAG: hypothetical protein ROM54_02550 [Anaerobiospirillum sp.]|nr:hypothetical protein [Anaerobiospirillum sp.]
MEHKIDLAAIKGPLTSLFPAVKNCHASTSNENKESPNQPPLPQDSESVLEYECIPQILPILTPSPIHNRDELISKASSIVTDVLEKSIRSVLINIVSGDYLPRVIASPCPIKAHVSEDINYLAEPNSARFDNLANSKADSCTFVQDVEKLMKKMRDEGAEDLPSDGHNLTLLVPDTHMEYLSISTESCSSALDTLKNIYPKLKIVAIPGLHTAAYSFALLVYTSDVLGPAGYVVLNGDIKLTTAPRKIELPKYHLAITHLSQMAVLEGI